MLQGKVALEEHVVLPSLSAVGSAADSNDADYYADVRRRLVDGDLLRRIWSERSDAGEFDPLKSVN